jgi:hypothetical protein
MDFSFKPSDRLGDGELLGLDFIPDAQVRSEFRAWWPHGRGGMMNWDAVGLGTNHTGGTSWVFVEAKARFPELISDCGAEIRSLSRIRAALDETRTALAVANSKDWTHRYYQHANRLATLHFLTKHGEPARLVDVFLYGRMKSDPKTPPSAGHWASALDERKSYLGLSGVSELEKRVHDVYIDISGGAHPRSTHP